MNNELDRRAAFWDYFRREFLDAAIQELDTRKADKWLDDDDVLAFNSIRASLRDALLDSMCRYHKVLGEQIYSMRGDKQ